jgi:transcriptional regulator with XRE-family HTH domain
MGDLARAVGARMRAARMEASLSQAEMAARVGLGQVGYSGVERGRSLVTLETLVAVARVTGKPMLFFLGFLGQDPAAVEGLSAESSEVAGIMETLPQRERQSIVDDARYVAQQAAKDSDE